MMYVWLRLNRDPKAGLRSKVCDKVGTFMVTRRSWQPDENIDRIMVAGTEALVMIAVLRSS